jgi:hypothetical protein
MPFPYDWDLFGPTEPFNFTDLLYADLYTLKVSWWQ